VDRYCLSAFLTLDRSLKLTKTRVAQTLIRSRQRLTYEQALAVLERRDPGLALSEELVGVLRQVSDIAQGLRKVREQAGALNLFSVEHRFGLDVNGEPVEITRETSDISHQLIEECMLLANRAVAAWLGQRGLPCVFRIHEKPDEDRMIQFARYLEVYGLDSSSIQNRFGLQKMLDRLKQEPPTARLVLNYLCLRSFKKAVYAIDNIGHYALAFADYCHFTSPIRRYPDLLVHRLVKCALRIPGFEKTEVRRGYLDALARQSSNLEQRAESAERDLHARKSARYLSARIGEVFPGVVTGASGGGLTVQLMETGMEGFLPMRELKDDFYRYDADRMALVGDRSGRVIGIGTEVDAQVMAVDIVKADIVLGLEGTTRLGRMPEAPRREDAGTPARADGQDGPRRPAGRQDARRSGDQERPRRRAQPQDPEHAAREALKAAKAARQAEKLAARKASHEERKAKRGTKEGRREDRKKSRKG
jgi:ribonuclease R